MRHRRYLAGLLLAPPVFALVFGALACGSAPPEKLLLERFFAASRYRDNVTLAGMAMVAFDEGIVENFSLVSVGQEQSEPLHLKELSADRQKASSKQASEATAKMAGEHALAQLSIHQGLARDPAEIDVTGYDGAIVSKDLTISANLITPSNQRFTRTLVVTLQRVVLRDPDGRVTLFPGRTEKGELLGKWIITKIKNATAGATS